MKIASVQQAEKTLPMVTLEIDGGTLVPNITNSLKSEYKNEITIRDVFDRSGIIKFSKDGKTIQSVNDMSLDLDMEWVVRLNGKALPLTKALDTKLNADDHIQILVQESKAQPKK